MKRLFIKGGRVIDPSENIDKVLNIIVEEDRISDISKDSKAPEGAEVIDAKGAIVSPGFIDMHTHLRDPGYEYKEDIATGSAAAAAGGFTTICCMPNTNPANDCAAVTEYILTRAKALSKIEILPVGAITKGLKGELLADIGDLSQAGAVAISDDGMPVMNSGLMRRAMEYARSFNLPVISHAEDLNLRGKGVMHEGMISTELGLRGIPAAVEESMVARDILLSELTGSHLHIAHLSTEGGVNLIHMAKKKKLSVTCEATPHHFTLTDQAVYGYDTNTKVNPPLRSEVDKEAVIKALADGTIDVIATDHAPHAITEKELGFEDSSFGMIGLETALPLALKLVHDKKISLKRMIDAFSCRPAKILKLKGRGALKIGNYADITIFNESEAITVQASKFKSKSRNTPFDGWRLRGKVLFTVAKGKIAYSA